MNEMGKLSLYCLKRFLFGSLPFPGAYPMRSLFLGGPIICTYWKDNSVVEM